MDMSFSHNTLAQEKECRHTPGLDRVDQCKVLPVPFFDLQGSVSLSGYQP